MAENGNVKIKRVYGKEISYGDIIYNKENKNVFCSLDTGFFGKSTITLIKRSDGCYDLIKNVRNGKETNAVKIGQTFPTKDKNGKVVEGLTQATLGLSSKWNKEKEKNVIVSNDALFITTHKLKEPVKLKKGFKKVGYITGRIGIEVAGDVANGGSENNYEAPQVEIDNDEIPF